MFPATPRAVTVTANTPDGAEAVVQIEGSPTYVAERLAQVGNLLDVAMRLLSPGQTKHFKYVQAEEL